MRRRAGLGKEEEWLEEDHQAWARGEVCVCKEDLEWEERKNDGT